MKIIRCLYVFIALGIAFPSLAEESMITVQIPIPTATPAWISNLKCSDIALKEGHPNMANALPFSLWMHGYLTGVASTLPLDHLDPKNFNVANWVPMADFDAHVITSCRAQPNRNAVDAAIDVAAILINGASKKNVLLRGTDGKWE